MSFTMWLCLVFIIGCTTVRCESAWESDYTTHGSNISLMCNDTKSSFGPNSDDILHWTKHGSHDALTNNAHYELRPHPDGLAGYELHIMEVSDETDGIYFCHVSDSSNQPRGTIMRGVNVGGRPYDDYIDKYETNIIIGVIAAASVFVIITGVCLIDQFQYQTEEQKAERKEQKMVRRNRYKANYQNGGHENQGLDSDERYDDRSGREPYLNTHL